MSKGYQPKVESWPIEDLVPYEGNAKIHTEEQIKSLAKQIQKTGWDVPIVVDKSGSIIKGHGRRLAAIQLKLKRVPVIVRRDLSKDDVAAARLADNRVAVGDIDTDVLQSELMKLADAEYELSSIGFDDKELDFLTEDPLDDMDMSAFDDPDGEGGGAPAVAEDVQVGKALGFTHIHKDNLATIKIFMAKIENDTDKEGEAALVQHIQSVMTDD